MHLQVAAGPKKGGLPWLVPPSAAYEARLLAEAVWEAERGLLARGLMKKYTPGGEAACPRAWAGQSLP